LRNTARVVHDPEAQERYAARVSAELGLLTEGPVELVVMRGEYGGRMAWVEQGADPRTWAIVLCPSA
jgi:hypothetical protein